MVIFLMWNSYAPKFMMPPLKALFSKWPPCWKKFGPPIRILKTDPHSCKNKLLTYDGNVDKDFQESEGNYFGDAFNSSTLESINDYQGLEMKGSVGLWEIVLKSQSKYQIRGPVQKSAPPIWLTKTQGGILLFLI